MPPAAPRLSILIPNYNNGRQSSRTGDRDFIADLLQSLLDTLHDDPTPLEVIVYDDGSTDDSLATVRAWRDRAWPDGRRFLELIEAPHCGYLSRTANVLCRRARGDILVRLDGDVVCLTRHWAAKVAAVFDHGPPNLGIIGPKQLTQDGRIHAFGDWLLHPNGYCHVAAGLERHAVRTALEVDHVMGCFHCMKKAVYDDVGGYDENFLRGQTEDLGLRALLKGWRCWAVPQIEFLHVHGLRAPRDTEADTAEGVTKTLKVFEDKWGFSRLAPDLDAVARRYAGTPLLWNARWFAAGAEDALDPPPPTPLTPAQSDWARYGQDPATKLRLDFHVAVVKRVIEQTQPPQLAALVGCGSGVLAHLLAAQGVPVVGTDRHAANMQFAREATASQKYPGPPPRFVQQTDPPESADPRNSPSRRLPLADEEADLVLLLDQMEKHPNPVVLLREAWRVTPFGGLLLIVSQRRADAVPAATDPEHRYLWKELVAQVSAVGGWHLLVDPGKDDLQRAMVLIARKGPR